MKRCVRAAVFAVTSAIAMLSSHARAADALAPDGVALTGGNGNQVDVFGVAANWNFDWNFARSERAGDQGGFSPRLVGQVSYWRGTQRPTEHGSLWDFSLTPFLRWAAPGTGPRLYAEAGVGVHLLTATRINNDRVFSTAFQFGEQGGFGVSFGPEQRYELGVYVQHVSNGRIKEPNDGLTYFGLLFRTALR